MAVKTPTELHDEIDALIINYVGGVIDVEHRTLLGDIVDSMGGAATKFGLEDNLGAEERVFVNPANVIDLISGDVNFEAEASEIILSPLHTSIYTQDATGLLFSNIGTTSLAASMLASGNVDQRGLGVYPDKITITKGFDPDNLPINLPLSVNGEFADITGNITIVGGGGGGTPTLQEVLTEGNALTTNNEISLEGNNLSILGIASDIVLGTDTGEGKVATIAIVGGTDINIGSSDSVSGHQLTLGTNSGVGLIQLSSTFSGDTTGVSVLPSLIQLTVPDAGLINLPNWGVGNHLGDAAYLIGLDVFGNLVETALGDGGGGGAIPTLQQVTDEGDSSDHTISSTLGFNAHSDAGTPIISVIDDNTTNGISLVAYAGGSGSPRLNYYIANFGGVVAELAADNITDIRTLQLPDFSATLVTSVNTLLADSQGRIILPEYAANFSQQGTDDPQAAELINTTGRTITWTRTGVGTYLGQWDAPLPFTNSRIRDVIFPPLGAGAAEVNYISIEMDSDGNLIVKTGTPTALADGLLDTTSDSQNFYTINLPLFAAAL